MGVTAGEPVAGMEAPAMRMEAERADPTLRAGAAHLSALWGLAVVQPALALIGDGDNASYFFAARDVTGALFAAVLAACVLVPPLLLVALEAAAGRRRRRVHLVLMWGLFALLVLYGLERLFRAGAAKPDGALILMAMSAGIGWWLTRLYRRHLPFRSALSVLSPAPLASLLMFLFLSPASGLVVGGEAAEPAPAPPSRTPVVMVVFDELPTSTLMDARGRIDGERFPAFGELARGSTWYRNTIASADETVQAIPALLTGKRRRRGELPIYSRAPDSVFTAFGRSHRIHAMEHATRLCPPSICPTRDPALSRAARVASALSLLYPDVIIPEGLTRLVGVSTPDVGRTWGEALRPEDPARPVDELIRVTDDAPLELSRFHDAQFERFLRDIRPYSPDDGRAPLHLLHSSTPHLPWMHLPDGRVYSSIREQLPGRSRHGEWWTRERALVELAWQRHLLQARFADRLLGRLIARLRRDGLWERALVVVVADHGVSFLPGGNRRFANPVNAADVAMVPLFVKEPGQRRGRVSERPLQGHDVLPTVADVLDARVPYRTDGRSALRPGPPLDEAVITSYTGRVVRAAPADLERARERTLRRQLGLFGAGDEGGGGFGIGPARGLVGRRVGRTVPAGSARARIEHPERYRSVDPGSRHAPEARVEGDLEGVPAGASLAVAVNGRVAGVGPAFRSGDGVRFLLIASDRFICPGRNDVRLYRVGGRPGRWTLAPLG